MTLKAVRAQGTIRSVTLYGAHNAIYSLNVTGSRWKPPTKFVRNVPQNQCYKSGTQIDLNEPQLYRTFYI